MNHDCLKEVGKLPTFASNIGKFLSIDPQSPSLDPPLAAFLQHPVPNTCAAAAPPQDRRPGLGLAAGLASTFDHAGRP